MRERIVNQETGHAAFNIKIHLDNMVSEYSIFQNITMYWV